MGCLHPSLPPCLQQSHAKPIHHQDLLTPALHATPGFGERSRPAKHNVGWGRVACTSSRAPALPPLPSQEVALYWDLVTTTPPKPAPLLPFKEKKERKSKEHRTGLCGLSTAAPGGYLRLQLTVWPVWLPLWVEESKSGVGAGRQRQLAWGKLVPGAARPWGGWVLSLGAGGRGRRRAGRNREDRSLGVLRTCSCLSHLFPGNRGGRRRQELECADFLNPGPLECVSNTSHGAL